MTVARYVPDRGHLVRLNFDPQVGHEQRGFRPALVLSPAHFNGPSGLAVVCPITSRGKGYPMEVAVPGGLQTYGYVLVDGVKSLDWSSRGVVFVEDAPVDLVEQVTERLATLLDIPLPPGGTP